MALERGLTGTATLTVREADTSIALGSGDVPTLGTPRVVALAEEACVAALSGELPEGTTTVGASVQIDHVAPTAIGKTVTAEATLARVEGRRLHFRVRVTDDNGLVAAGQLTRAVVNRARFLEKAGVPEEGVETAPDGTGA